MPGFVVTPCIFSLFFIVSFIFLFEFWKYKKKNSLNFVEKFWKQKFSVLNLPSNVNLLHASATSSSSRTSFANQQRKSMMFTLKIYDKTANERHTLKYAGDKSISSIKRDVYSLTLIPDHRQIWTGWPSNYGERVRIFSRIYYFAFLRLTLRFWYQFAPQG